MSAEVAAREAEDEGVLAHRGRAEAAQAGAVADFFGAGLLFLIVLALVTHTDAPPPEVSDLGRGEHREPAEADNFYVGLIKLGETLPVGGIVPEYEPGDLSEGSPERMPDTWRGNDSYVHFRDFLAAGRGWTPSRLASWDAPLAQLVEDCAALIEIEESLAPDDILRTHRGVREIGEQLTAAAGMYRKAGYADKCVEILMLSYRMGRRVELSRGGLRLHLMALEMQDAAIRNLGRLTLDDEAAAGLIAAQWARHRGGDAPEVFAEAVRMEYPVFAAEVDELDARTVAVSGPELFSWIAKTRVLYPLVMKPNATKALYADYLRRQAEWCDLTRIDYEARGGYDLLRLEPRDVLRPVNLHGRLTAWWASYPASAYARRADHRSAVSVFEAVLALRLYHAEHGALPESLDELVPRYLPAVPVDSYDGAPIRYSRATAEVWSAVRATERERLEFAVPRAP